VVGVSAPRVTSLVQANQPVPPGIVAKLVVDTGASLSAVDISILKQLGLTPKGKTPIHTPSTQGQAHLADAYDISILIFGDNALVPCYLLNALPVIDGNFKTQGFDGLLGRDILKTARMTYSGHDNWYGISF
jgi:Aspartyl protease